MDLFLEIKYSKCSGTSKGAGQKEAERNGEKATGASYREPI